MSSWDERFRAGEYPRDPDPSPILRDAVEGFPDGRALDIATGTGRNALFLAERGYDVDAIDKSRSGLEIARESAIDRSLEINWIQADIDEYTFPESTYDVISISFFRTLDRLADIKAALAPNGILFYEHHLRTTDPVTSGPQTDRYRFSANELMRACLDLTVLRYEETIRTSEDRTSAIASIIARNSTGAKQRYPGRS